MSKPIVKGLAGVVMMVIGAYTGQAWLVQMGSSMILAGASQALAKNPKAPGFKERDGIEINVTGEDQALFRCYGEVKVGGHLSIIGTSGSRNENLHYAVTHSVANACGIEDITDVWIGDRNIDDTEIDGAGDATDATYSGFVNVQRYLGTSAETTDVDLNAALSYVDANARGDYMAKTVWTFVRDINDEDDDKAFQKAFPNGPPQVQALVRGQKVYDPRLDSTNGGSGTHRKDTPSTWAWSRNPILCAVDYARAAGNIGGIDISDDIIDWTSIATAASICDESITVPDGAGGDTTQARYTLDIALDTGEDTKANLDRMMMSCMGAVVYTGDTLKFHAGAYETPVSTVDNDWLRGSVSVQRLTAIGAKYNSVRSTFIDPGAEYQTVQSQPFTDATYVTQDGGKELWKEVKWAGVYDRYAAQYLNQILGRMSRNQKIVVAELNFYGMDIEAWEVVTLDFPDLDISGSYRVTAWEWTEQGPKVTFEELASDTYDIARADFTQINPTARPGETQETPPAPTGLSATATADGIALAWTNPGLGEFSVIEIYRATSSGGSFSKIRTTKSDAYTDPVTDGSTYYYKLKARSATGSAIVSAFTSEVTATAKAALAGGRGVNVMHPRYSHFSELIAPSIAVSGTTATLNTTASTIAYGGASLQVARVAGGSGYAFLSPASGTYNLLLRPKKYIVSAYLRRSAGDASDFGCEVRIRKNDGTYYTPINVTINTTRTRYSGVVDLSANSIEDSYNVSIWNTGGGGSDAFVSAIMIEELAGNQTDPSDYAPPVAAAGSTAIAADEGQVASHTSLRQVNTANIGATTDSSPLTAADVGSDATISIAAHSMVYGGGSVSNNSGSITGRSFSTGYIVYADDRHFAGGALTYASVAQSSRTTAISNDRVNIGFITTPANGGGGTGGEAPGGCVSVAAWLSLDLRADEARKGSPLDIWVEEFGLFPGHVENEPPVFDADCVEIKAGAATLICSKETPIPVQGGWVPAGSVNGKTILVDTGSALEWHQAEASDAGVQPVVRISVGGLSYAAGMDRNGPRIISHNSFKP